MKEESDDFAAQHSDKVYYLGMEVIYQPGMNNQRELTAAEESHIEDASTFQVDTQPTTTPSSLTEEELAHIADANFLNEISYD